MRNTLLMLTALAALGCSREATHSADSPKGGGSESDATATASAQPPRHHADLAPTQGNSASGRIELIPTDGELTLTGSISGLEPNSEHGFHIHENGDCSAPDASSAGGHFNPTSKAHGNPDSPPHHAGDMPNLVADAQGTAKVNAKLADVTAGGGPASLLGKAIVVHAKADDYKSQPAGNSGARIACGVIQ
jgi:superoxide dismutase, Cu-Zn family